MSSSNTLFTGNSRYAQDFQAVIQRAVKIASLPLAQYQSQKSRLSAESTALSGFTSKFSALESALGSLASAAGASGKRAVSSDEKILTAAAGREAEDAVYTLEITDAGSFAASLSLGTGLPKVTNPAAGGLSGSTSFTLTVTTDPGTPSEKQTPVALTTKGQSLNDLRDAINGVKNGTVRATVVNVGTAAAPDYRLSVQSTVLGKQNIQIHDGAQNLLSFQAAGSTVRYKLNGSTDVFESTSRTLALAPGLTVDVKAAGAGSPVTLRVEQDTAGLNGALSSVAHAYNAVVDEIDTHRGGAGGALSGNAILGSLSRALQGIAFYQAGSVSLANMGLEVDSKGHMSVNSKVFGAAARNLPALGSFVGGDKSGFVGAAKALLEGVTGSNGVLTSTVKILQDDITAQDRLIQENQTRIDQLEQRLMDQLAAADAMIAQFEQQAVYMSSMFQAMAGNSRNG